MRINCDSCGKEFTLPEEKLPDAARFRVRCPSCSHRIAVERPGRGPREEGTAGEQPQSAGTASRDDSEGAEYLGLTPEKENNGLLLIQDKDLLEAVRAALEKQGFRLVAASSSGEAVRILHGNPLSQVVMEDGEESAPLLRELNIQPGYTRRELNCILVGDRGRSFDKQQAFLLGVNVYLSRSDMDRFGELLPRAVGKYWQFIHPWLVARGEV